MKNLGAKPLSTDQHHSLYIDMLNNYSPLFNFIVEH